MPRWIEVEDLQAPGLEPYRTLRQPDAHVRAGIFVAEGDKVVQALLDRSWPLRSLLLLPRWRSRMGAALEALPEGVTIYTAPAALLEGITGHDLHQGIMAVAEVPPPLTLGEALQRSSSPRLWLAFDGLASAENVGTIARSAAAFGVQTLVFGAGCSPPYLRRTVRASMGGILDLNVVQSQDLPGTLRALAFNGIRPLAAHPREDSISLPRVDLTTDVCIVLGAEGTGLSAPVLAACEAAVAIPMPPHVDSLNVGCAAAVFLYETLRQRVALNP